MSYFHTVLYCNASAGLKHYKGWDLQYYSSAQVKKTVMSYESSDVAETPKRCVKRTHACVTCRMNIAGVSYRVLDVTSDCIISLFVSSRS